MNSLQDCYTLPNGVKIPCVGLGTYLTDDGETCVRAVKAAIEAGYRHIDTAVAYGNEASVGKAVRECGLPREQIFVTSKLRNVNQGYKETKAAFEVTMKELGLEYLDLYLIHWPIARGHKQDWQEHSYQTWRAFEELYEEGRVRAIGISNFLTYHLQPLLERAKIMPMVNQLELHPGYHQDEIVKFCKEKGMVIEAWSPMMQGKQMQHPLLIEIGNKYGKTPAQVCVRWSLQNGFLPLPKSVNHDRIRQNGDVFDFSLTDEDMKAISSLETIGRLGPHPDTIYPD